MPSSIFISVILNTICGNSSFIIKVFLLIVEDAKIALCLNISSLKYKLLICIAGYIMRTKKNIIKNILFRLKSFIFSNSKYTI